MKSADNHKMKSADKMNRSPAGPYWTNMFGPVRVSSRYINTAHATDHRWSGSTLRTKTI